jgi:LuxR family transcriptional regulator, maltose regulon positive regulatory protein
MNSWGSNHISLRQYEPENQPSSLSPLIIHNLGRFEIKRGPHMLAPCRSRKALALLRYLLWRAPLTVHKETLMELFWPEMNPKEAGHNLHMAISTLRRYIDNPPSSYICFAVGTYFVNPAAQFEEESRVFYQLADTAERRWQAGDLAEGERLSSQAVACYHGDYYVDSRALGWELEERDRLQAIYLRTLERLGRRYIETQRYEQALESARQLLSYDCYREDIHALMMRCYLALGRRNEAARQYQRCAFILSSELGLEPMQELHELYQASKRT